MADQSPITAEELAEEAELPVQCLDTPFCVEHAHLLSGFFDRWESIGYGLKLTKSDISSIKDDNSDAEMRRITMLQTWKERFAHKATYRVLVEALLQSGLAQQALDMCRKIKHELGITLQSCHDESGGAVCAMPRDHSPSLMELQSTDSREYTFGEELDVTAQSMCNGNQEEITRDDDESKKASRIFWNENEAAIRDYFSKMTCNLRVLGSQLGLEPYDLDEVEHQCPLGDQRQRLLGKCIDKEKLTSWEHLAATLEKPSLNLSRMADEIRSKHIYLKQDSMESRSSISSPMSLEHSFSPTMEVDQSEFFFS